MAVRKTRAYGVKYSRIPTSGILSSLHTVRLDIYDANGALLAPDAAPTVAWANLGPNDTFVGSSEGVALLGTGQYEATLSGGGQRLDDTWIEAKFSWNQSGIPHEAVFEFLQTNSRAVMGGTGGLEILIPPSLIVPKVNSRDTRILILVRNPQGILDDPRDQDVAVSYEDPAGGTLPAGLPTSATFTGVVGVYQIDIPVLSTQSKEQQLIMTVTADLAYSGITSFDEVLTQKVPLEFASIQPASISIGE